MVAVKAHQAQGFLKSPDPRLTAVLFYGSDAGLVLERAQVFAKAWAERQKPEGEVIRIDDADLETDPDRLSVELRTIPMFGGPKVVRASAGRRVNAAALKPLVGEDALEGMLIVEAGNLKPDDALRQLFEKAGRAAAVACYSDAAADLAALVRDELASTGLTITAEAREALIARLGADRAMSRGEIAKLALYAQGKGEIGLADVEAIVGDASELALERIYLAAASGEGARAVAEFGRAVASGESAQSIIVALQRHFQRLHRVRAAIEKGQGVEDALRQIRPPLHFKLKDQVSAQCRAWSFERLSEAQRRISACAKAARLTGALEDALTERLLLGLGMLAGSSSRFPGRR
jgi:DNA polymerase-3 subunit delta